MSLLIPRLAALVLAGSMLCPLAASAGSVVRVEDTGTAGGKGSVSEARLRGMPADPAACARDFHAKLKPIAEGPFQSVKAALDAPVTAAPAPAPSGEGGMIFPPNARSRGPEQTAALRAAMAAARGTSGFAPRDNNAKWTAMRIREDLGDFLTQGPSPYLCAGIDAYLTTLKRFASQVSVSPDRRQRDLQAARAMALASLSDALQALRPVPVPTFAPEERAVPTETAQALPSDIGAKNETVIGPPMLVAGRETGETRISEGDGTDPDLPPLKAPREHRLDSEADISASVAELGAAIRDAAVPRPGEAQRLDATTTGSVAAPIGPAAPEPDKTALQRLAELKPLFAPDGQFQSDPRTRLAVTGALSDLEAVDRLLQAAKLPEDPLGAAFSATFDAIETAHAESCRCKM